LWNVGIYHQGVGNVQTALEMYQQARMFFAEIGATHKVEAVDRSIAALREG
jgi:hypothetical protein